MRKSLLLSLLALLFLGTAVHAETEIPPETLKKLQEHVRTGQRSFNDGRYKESIEAFGAFIGLLPADKSFDMNRAHANYYIACAHSNLNQKDPALAHLEKAIDFGYHDADEIKGDDDLAGIRNHEKFTKLLAKAEKLKQDALQKFDFKLTTLEGKPIAKKDFLGKVLIVDVWGTWCPPCRMEIPHFIELVKKYKDKGLRIVGLNKENGTPAVQAKTARDFIKKNGVNYPCALVTDEVIATIPNFRAFPTTIFIGRDGKVRKIAVGYHPLEDLEEWIKPLLAEKAPEQKKDGEKPEQKKTEDEPAEKKPAEKEPAS